MSDTPFLNYRSLLLGALLLFLVTLAMVAMGWLFGVTKATAPQLLTLSALWIAPGLYVALQARDGCILHGMLAGMLGALLVVWLFQLAARWVSEPSVMTQLAGSRVMVLLVLGGLWGSIGGLFAEIVHLRRVRKGRKTG